MLAVPRMPSENTHSHLALAKSLFFNYRNGKIYYSQHLKMYFQFLSPHHRPVQNVDRHLKTAGNTGEDASAQASAKLENTTIYQRGTSRVGLKRLGYPLNDLLELRLVDESVTKLVCKYVLDQGPPQLMVVHRFSRSQGFQTRNPGRPGLSLRYLAFDDAAF